MRSTSWSPSTPSAGSTAMALGKDVGGVGVGGPHRRLVGGEVGEEGGGDFSWTSRRQAHHGQGHRLGTGPGGRDGDLGHRSRSRRRCRPPRRPRPAAPPTTGWSGRPGPGDVGADDRRVGTAVAHALHGEGALAEAGRLADPLGAAHRLLQRRRDDAALEGLLAVDAVDEHRRRLVAIPPTNEVRSPSWRACWVRIRKTSRPTAKTSSPNRTTARRISWRARNISSAPVVEPGEGPSGCAPPPADRSDPREALSAPRARDPPRVPVLGAAATLAPRCIDARVFSVVRAAASGRSLFVHWGCQGWCTF